MAAKTELQTFSLNPTSLQEAIQFSEIMAKSDMVPKAFKGNSGNILVAVQMGAELGMPAMQSIQNIAVINGKPGIYGDLGKALLLNKGCIIEEDDTEVIKKNQKATCRISRKGMPTVERTFSVDDAKNAGLWNKEGPWRTYPWRQLAWRAFWFAARDAAADILKGMSGAEELTDTPVDMGSVVIDNETSQTVGAAGLSEKLKSSKPAQPAGSGQPDRNETVIVDAEVVREGETTTETPAASEAQTAESESTAQPESKKAKDPLSANPNKIKVVQGMLKKSGMTEEALFQALGVSGFDEIEAADINKVLTAASGK